MEMRQLDEWFSNHSETVLQDFFTFLRFKSIATDPTCDSDTRACSKWLVAYLEEMGMNAEEWSTSGKPVVFAKSAPCDGPTLMIYHHYDVQPVDPISLWTSDPFEPELRDGNIYARGAQDNKGQCFYTLIAIKAFLELSNELNFNLHVFIEGEEESGSGATQEVLEEKKEELKCDYLLAIDSGIPAVDIPAITLGIRGILTIELEVQTAETDMHSGAMGGIGYNAARALTHALSKCFDEEGKVAVPNFYDGIEELSREERDELELHIDEEKVKKELGLKALCPDPGYSIGESVSIRPTLEINGIEGGYTGEGFKTVLPAKASAKISARLVPGQDSEKIFENFKSHIQSHLPKGAILKIEKDAAAPAFRSKSNSLIAKRTKKAYEEVMGKPCKSIFLGGSIPIMVQLAEVSGAETVLMGFGLDSDNIHAPNEHFGFDRLKMGFLTVGNILEQFNAK